MEHETWNKIKSIVESLLFAAGKPISYNQIAKILKIDQKEAEQTIRQMQKEYQEQKRGFRIVSNNYQAEMTSAPENAEMLSQFLNYEKSAISQAKIEALTVLAYKGPLTQAELEEIRGVNCSVILRNLKIDDLIDGIKQGDMIKYQVSVKFLKMLGIESVEELQSNVNCLLS
ncbi:MAG: SMC-Scp complex subunit ScpB [Patescibacteria group bacterium]